MALIVAGVVLIVGLAIATIYVVSERKLEARITLPAESVVVPDDIGSLQRGQHMVGAVALCTQCHGFTMAGGVVRDDYAARVVAPNITRGGSGAGLRNVDFARAIRDGLDPSGRVLLSMPSDDYYRMDDTDLASVIAYLESLPAVPSTLQSSQVHPLGRVLLVLGQLPLLPAAAIDRSAPRPPAVTPAGTPEYGGYLVKLAGCARCHGPGLSGGKVPGAPPTAAVAANLTPAALGDWSEVDFVRAMRSGRRPDNRRIDTLMPWPYYAQMSDLELRAIWQFLGVIPARATGSG
jgi:cytochrome c553